MSVTIYHNPRCSKSRQTLQLLQDKGIEPTIVEYLKTPLNPSELKNILNLLDKPAKEIVRSNEDAFKQFDLELEATDDELIQAIVEQPVLLQRPIVTANGKATIGRPPESVLEIL
ncbi:MAG: arsenate reductase (glutaredoxin) [Gammaproteobacteria bacterium]|nr:arsenate reductase (glutaredoxin) [Gammaproteobacteria bacterium]